MTIAIVIIVVGVLCFTALAWAGLTACPKCGGWCEDCHSCKKLCAEKEEP